VAVGVAVVAVGRDFTDVGHVVALALGMLVAKRFRRPEHWTPARFVLLGVAAAFGYLVLASTDLLIATAAGVAGAVVAESALRTRLRRRSVPRVHAGAVAPESNACEAPSGHRL
jgi:hypothetical protein